MPISLQNSVIVRAWILLLVPLTITCPAQAFTAENRDIAIHDYRDAAVTITYGISWYGNVAVSSPIVNPRSGIARD